MRISTVHVRGDDPIAEIVFAESRSAESWGVVDKAIARFRAEEPSPVSDTARIIIKARNGKPDMGLYITRTEDGISFAPYSIEFEDGGEIDTLFVEFKELSPED